jgi:uncharacterized protein (DUF433 family)
MSQANLQSILDQIQQLPPADRVRLEQRLAGADSLAAALRTDETGTIRVGRSRVTLDVVLADHRRGLTPEEIVHQLDTLDLGDVYAAIAYYHRHRAEVEAYLAQRKASADALRAEIEASQPDRSGLKERLLRKAQRDGGDAPAGQ